MSLCPSPLDAPHDDALLLGIEVEHLDAMLFPEATVLGAAERQLVVGDQVDLVDPAVANVQPVDRLLGLLDVTGEDRGAEAELGVVRPLDRLIEALDPSDRQQWPKGF